MYLIGLTPAQITLFKMVQVWIDRTKQEIDYDAISKLAMQTATMVDVEPADAEVVVEQLEQYWMES